MRGSTRASGLTCLLAATGLWVGGLQGVAKAQDTLVQWTGVLELIDGDAGSGAFSGGNPGVSPFEGYFVHPTSCAAGCLIEPFPPDATNYVFSGGAGLITGLGASVQGVESSIEIIDEEVLDQDGVDFAAFFGIPVTVGQTVDSWVLSSENAAEFTPAFVDWGLTFLYITSDPFASTAFVSAPPPNPDLIVFEVYEDNGDVYAGVGSATVVPEPGFAALLAAGSCGLALRGRYWRRRHGEHATRAGERVAPADSVR